MNIPIYLYKLSKLIFNSFLEKHINKLINIMKTNLRAFVEILNVFLKVFYCIKFTTLVITSNNI